MAATYETSRALGFAAATTHDLTSVVVQGTDRVLYVWVGNRTSIANVTGVVLDPGGANEAALTLVESEGDVTASDGIYVTLHRLINPPTGTFTVRVTITTSGRLTAGAICVSGAHQTTPERTLAKNRNVGTDCDITGITSNANDLVLACINSRQGASAITHTEDGGQTARWDEVVTSGGGASSQHRSSGCTEAGAASVDVGYTLGSSQGWAMVAVSVQEAAGGGGAVDGDAALSIPAMDVTAAGGVQVRGASALSTPGFTINAASTVRITGSASQGIPPFSITPAGAVRVTGSAAQIIPAFSISASSQQMADGDASLTIPAFTITPAGTVLVSGSASLALPMFAVSSAGGVRIAGAASISLAAFTIAPAGTVRVGAAASVEIPAFTITANPVGPETADSRHVFAAHGDRRKTTVSARPNTFTAAPSKVSA